MAHFSKSFSESFSNFSLSSNFTINDPDNRVSPDFFNAISGLSDALDLLIKAISDMRSAKSSNGDNESSCL